MQYPKIIEEKVIENMFGKVVLKRKFKLPNGKIIKYLNWGGLTPCSIVLPLTFDKKVVALKQFRYGIKDVVVELPGGTLLEDETAQEAARKELREETGYTTESLESFTKLGPSIWFEPANCITPFVPILATGCQKVGEPKSDETEFIEVILYPLSDWIDKILAGEIIDSKSIGVTFLALPHLGINHILELS